MNRTNDIDFLVENINCEIKSAVDRAITKIPANEFYKWDPYVRILTTNINRAKEVLQWMRKPKDKIIMNRAQKDLKDYLYRKGWNSWSDFIEKLSPEDTFIWKADRRFKN